VFRRGWRGGRFFRVMGYHAASFGVFFFGVWSFRVSDNFFCHLLYILSKFYRVGRGGCCAVVLGGWLLRAVAGVHKSYAMHKSPTVHVIPLFVEFGAPTAGGPRRPFKMTSDECCDDVWWCPYPGTSQRNHDHQCSKFFRRPLRCNFPYMFMSVYCSER
jgi:hypothetical protein